MTTDDRGATMQATGLGGDWLAGRPLLLCALCLLAGIVAGEHHLLGQVASGIICLLTAVTALIAARRAPDVSSRALLVAFFSLGAFLHATHMTIPADDISRLQGRPPAAIEGVVVSPPEARGARRQFRLRVSSVAGRHAGGVASVPAPPPPEVAAGDRIRLEDARVSLPHGAKRPGDFDYRRWLRRQGVTAEVSSREVTVLAPADVGERRVADWRAGLRSRVIGAIERAMPGAEGDLYARLLAGMVYGLEASPLPDHIIEDFRRAGTIHLLVVSGAQVTMLMLAVLWLAGGRRYVMRWWQVVLVGLALAVLVLIVGLGESVARALAMFALLALAALSGRDYDLPTAIGFAAMVICVLDTTALFSLGFQLTFAATAGVALFLPYSTLLHINKSPAVASVQILRGVLWGTVGAWVMTTPLLAHTFGGFAFTGNIANLINVPLSGLVMGVGFLALPLSLIPGTGWLLVVLCAAARMLLRLVMGVNLLAGSLPLAYVDGLHLSALGCVLWYALVALLLLSGGLARAHLWLDRRLLHMHPAWMWIGGLLVIALIAGAQTFGSLPPSGMQVTLLPVGGGQCAIVRSPSGATMMVDCGGNTGGPGAGPRLAEDVISPWLSQHRIRRLDWVVITHWDADHFNALASVLERVPCEMVLLPPELPEARMPDELREVLTARAVHAWSGGVVRLGAGVRAEVFSPRRPLLTGTEDDANNNSVVLRLAFGERAMLLMGDLEADGLQALVRSATSNGRDLSADVVCLPHHGRSLAATWRLLELAGPEWAVVSCDRQAGYYLGPDAEAKLSGMGIELLRTDLHGAITVTTDGRRLRVTRARASR